MKNINTPAVQLKLNLSHRITESQQLHTAPEVVSFEMTAEKFRILHSELRSAAKMMGALEG